MLKAIFFDAVGTVMTMGFIEDKTHHSTAKDQGLTVHEFVVAQPMRDWVLYPETIEVLDAVRAKGLKTALISNFDSKIHELISHLGLSDKFDLVISSEEAGASKPHPKIYNTALSKLGLVAEEALMIGDSYSGDYEAPMNLGMQAIYLDRSKDDLKVLLNQL